MKAMKMPYYVLCGMYSFGSVITLHANALYSSINSDLIFICRCKETLKRRRPQESFLFPNHYITQACRKRGIKDPQIINLSARMPS
jgi:hypothetical protein